MNGKRYNLPLDMWQVERINDWLRANDANNGYIFLIAVPLAKEARLEIVGWSGQEAHDAHKTFLEAMKQHYPGYAELRKINANTGQDAQGGKDELRTTNGAKPGRTPQAPGAA